MTPAVILDTSVLIRLFGQPELVADDVLEMVAEPRTNVFVSAASAWEMSTNARAGRLPGGEALVSTWREALGRLGVEQLSIDPEDALLAGGIDWGHRDPFDRTIVAQALRRALVVVTSDAVILDAGLVRVLDSRRA